VHTTAVLDPADLTRSPVLRTANELRAVATTTAPPLTTNEGPAIPGGLVQTATVPISDDAEAPA